jgi:L-rhamnose-H+ transport protein
MPNPLLGVLFHGIGGFASASFYVPYKQVRGWSWEVFWLTGGVASWVAASWGFAALQTHDLFGVLSRTHLGLDEWKGASGKSRGLLALGLAVLVGATVVIGVGNAMAVGAT